MTGNNFYKQPIVDAVAPDAIIFIDSGSQNNNNLKRTITMKDGSGNNIEVDFMNFVESITVSKGIDRVPGEATINVKAPKHMMDGVYGSIKNILSTMMEIQVYMKGRFVLNGEYPYYPVFWGVISNLSEVQVAGDLLSVTVTCQDMMRWLAITKVNVNASVYTTAMVTDPTAQVSQKELSKDTAHPYGSYYVQLSTPGVIRDLLNFTTGENFLLPQNLDNRSGSVLANGQTVNITIDSNRKYSDQLMKAWQEKFKDLAGAFYVYGYKDIDKNANQYTGVSDLVLDMDAYKYIYGSRPVTITNEDPAIPPVSKDLPWMDISKMFSFGAAPFNSAEPPVFESNFQNRLDVANEAKDQAHLEFYQDVDGTIVLKPQFYNMDTRKNPVYVINDIDIVSMSSTEDESQVITRIDVCGTPVNGYLYGKDVNSSYGYAIDFDKLQKYGLRIEEAQTNFLTSPQDAMLYAQRELARRNSLIVNGSITIVGRPEIKLGYPVYITSKDEFYYVTGIDHSFSFGSSFDTTLTLTARRKKILDPDGNPIKQLLTQCEGAGTVQPNVAGKNVDFNEDNLLKNITKLCDSQAYLQFVAERPNYHYKTLDDILQFQGSFKYFKTQQSQYDPRQFQQVTDNEGYSLLGNGFPFGRGLVLTEDLKIVPKGQESNEKAAIISSMTISTKAGERPTLSFQQPLTLDQITNVQVKSQTAKSIIPLTMAPKT